MFAMCPEFAKPGHQIGTANMPELLGAGTRLRLLCSVLDSVFLISSVFSKLAAEQTHASGFTPTWLRGPPPPLPLLPPSSPSLSQFAKVT